MSKLRFSTAQQIIDAFPVLKEEFSSLELEAPPIEFIKSLMEGGQVRPALALCAFMLPRREAVGWLCQSLRKHGGEFNTKDVKLLDLAEDWHRAPAEKYRLAAMQAALSSGFRTAPSWAAAAAGWTGGSMTENADLPIPPPPHMTGQAVKIGHIVAFWGKVAKGREAKVSDVVANAIALALAD